MHERRIQQLVLYGWVGCAFWCLGLVTLLLLRENDISHYSASRPPDPTLKIFAFDVALGVCLWKKKEIEKKWRNRSVFVHSRVQNRVPLAFQLCIKYKATTTNRRKAFRARQWSISQQVARQRSRRVIFPLCCCWCFPPWRRYPFDTKVPWHLAKGDAIKA